MANLRVFLSSTCFDLAVMRGQLRAFIEDMGHTPVMSDFGDVVYDPALHTHTSCIQEVDGCDVVVVLIGSRFGGKTVPQAVAHLDLDALSAESKSATVLDDKKNISITQLEVLRAIENKIPVFSFIDERVWNDHATYEKNKNKEIASQIEYASIDKPETARFIFEFINFLRHRSYNNGITAYSRYQDVEDALRRQWSGLFQRMLSERSAQAEVRRIDALAEQIEDLKSVIVTSLQRGDQQKVARGVLNFRRLWNFVFAFGDASIRASTQEALTFEQFLERVGVVEIVPGDIFTFTRDRVPSSAFLLTNKNSFYELRKPLSIEQLRRDWMDFMVLTPAERKIVFDALNEVNGSVENVRYIRFVPTSFYEYVEKKNAPAIRELTGVDVPINIGGAQDFYFEGRSIHDMDISSAAAVVKNPRLSSKGPTTG